jgi:hypothetical protein
VGVYCAEQMAGAVLRNVGRGPSKKNIRMTLETLLISWQALSLTFTGKEVHMKTRLFAVIGAIALVFAIGSASAFACGGASHHVAHKSVTKAYGRA